MSHPLTFRNKNGFQDHSGKLVQSGDSVRYLIDGREAILDEALHDGDAFVTWLDGTHGTVKWYHLVAFDGDTKI